MQTPTAARFAVLSLIISAAAWGLSWLPLKYFASLGLDGHAIALTAYALVGLVSLPVIVHERNQWRREAGLLCLIGLSFGIANVALSWALMAGSVVRTMLLFFLLPAWGVIGGKLLLHEHLGPRRLLAAGLCLLGVFIIVGGIDAFGAPLSFADIAALVAGLTLVLGGITNRAATRIPIASRTLAAFVGCTFIALLALPLHPVSLPPLSAGDWSLLALFAFVWLLGATLLTTYGVMHVDASRAGVLQVVELVVAVVSAVLIGGETLGFKEWLGAALILTASLLEALGHASAAPSEAAD